MIKATFLMPHPPVIIDAIGQGNEKLCQDVIDGLQQASERIGQIKPKTILVITPHGPVFSDGIAIGYDRKLKGDFGNFGYKEITNEKLNDLELVDEIIFESGKIGVPCLKLNDKNVEYFRISKALDHGVLVPLHFVDQAYQDYDLIHVTYGLFDSVKLYEFGQVIKRCADKLNRDLVVIASGDMSHCLKDDGPYKYHPDGIRFDKKVQEYLLEKNLEALMFFDEDLQKHAGECGKRSIDIMLGCLDGSSYDVTRYAYNGPFGVGYLVMGFEINGTKDSEIEKLLRLKQDHQDQKRAKEHPFVALARRSIEHFLGLREDVIHDDLPKESFETRAGAFVSIKSHGALRGCIGTIGPTEDHLVLEIVANAVKAGFEDPRFPPLDKSELEEISISVDVLMPAEKIDDMSQLDPVKYGVIVSSGYKRGLLLPNLEGIDSIEEQVRIAMQKGSINPEEDYELERFEVVRY